MYRLTPTSVKALLRAAAPWQLAILLSLILSGLSQWDEVDLRLKIADERNRGLTSYLFSSDRAEEAPPLLLLDLHTPETFDPSSEWYAQRYHTFKLPAVLNFLCKLNPDTLLLDMYLDEASWIGRHLQADAQDREALLASAHCFRQVLLPVRNDAKGALNVFPADQQIRYVHLDNVSDAVFRLFETVTTPMGELKVPHPDALDTGIGSGATLKPMAFRFHPQVWPIVRFDELLLFTELGSDLTAADAQSFYHTVFNRSSRPDPKWVLVGFSHDSSDFHNTPFNLGGNLEVLPHPGATQPLQWPLTPGLFMLASQLGSTLAGHDDTFNGYDVFSQTLIILMLIVLAQTLADYATRSVLGRLTVYCGVYLVYAILNHAIAWLAGLHFPLVLPLIALALQLSLSLTHQFSALLALLRTPGKVAQTDRAESRFFAAQPGLLVAAHYYPQSLTDSYKSFLAELDCATFWVHYLCMLAMADYAQHYPVRRNQVKDSDLQRLYKPTLGSYFYGLINLYHPLPPAHLASQSFLPRLAQHFSKRAGGPLQASLKTILDLRNEWKHFASSGHTDGSVEIARQQLKEAYHVLLHHVAFLEGYCLLQAIAPAVDERLGRLWKMRRISGDHPRIIELKTQATLVPNALYLWMTGCPVERESDLLRLDPWVYTDECMHHHQMEVFFYSGFEWDASQKRLSGCAFCSGMMEACKPVRSPVLPEWVQQRFVMRHH